MPVAKDPPGTPEDPERNVDGKGQTAPAGKWARASAPPGAHDPGEPLAGDRAGVGIASFSRDGRIVSVNARAAARLAGTPARLVGRTIRELYGEDGHGSFERRLREFESSGRFSSEDLVQEGAEERWYLSTWEGERDAEGRLTGVTVYSYDTTGWKRAERELRASEAKYRRLHDSMFEALVTVDISGRILDFNPPYLSLVGYSPEELSRLTYEDITPERWHSLESRIVEEQILVRGFSDVYEKEYRRKDGTVFPVELRTFLVRKESGEPEAMWAIVRDITRRREAEEALRKSEEQLRIAADAANLGVFTHDLVTNVVHVDARLREIFAFEEGELGFGEVLSRVHPEDAERVRDEFVRGNDPREGVERVVQEYRIVLPGGEVKWVSVCLRVHFAGTGPERRAVSSVGTVQDVTERKRMDEALLRTQKLEALGTLAGGVAHDFNNILLVIRGNATLAASELSPGHPARGFVEEIDRAGKRGASLVRQVLAFARPGPVERSVLPLGPIVEEARTFLRATVPTLVEIRARIERSCPPAAVDPGQVHQAVVNLVTNASDAIGSRPGLIQIVLEEEVVGEEAACKVPGLAPGRYARLTVADDGPGMDAATCCRVFDPFFSTKGPDKGSGLGLSIVHGIMRSHGGVVSLASEPGRGTVASLHFPAAEPVLAVPPAPAPQRRVRSEHLLFVDDDEALVSLAKRMLGRLGYGVTAFTDPTLALQEFRERPESFDAVITDVSMPRMSGFTLCRELLRTRPGVPVVITSGYIRAEDEETARSVGARAVILKPDSLEEMGATLDRIFGGPRAD